MAGCWPVRPKRDAGFDSRTTAQAVQELLALACRLVPAAWGTQPWSDAGRGLRPGSPDGMPFLGPVPGFDNLFVAAGHFRAGIQLSAGTALAMKELLLGQPVTLALEAFRLDRMPARLVGPLQARLGYKTTCKNGLYQFDTNKLRLIEFARFVVPPPGSKPRLPHKSGQPKKVTGRDYFRQVLEGRGRFPLRRFLANALACVVGW